MSGVIKTHLINTDKSTCMGHRGLSGLPGGLQRHSRGVGTEATLEGTWASLWDTRVQETEGARAQKQTLAKPCGTQDGRREEWGEAHEVSRDS